MRLLVLLCSIFAFVVASCSQGNCQRGENIAEYQQRPNRLISASRFWGKRAVNDVLRKSSLRWGKRSVESSKPSLQELRGSSRFWGKRDVPESLRRASLRWGKRSESIPELMPAGGFVFPLTLLNPESQPNSPQEQPQEPQELMERVAKAETLRPKLALSSRLWGR